MLALTTRGAKILALTLFLYSSLLLLPAVTCTLFNPPAANNGYSPYTMYERCHWQQFHIGPQSC